MIKTSPSPGLYPYLYRDEGEEQLMYSNAKPGTNGKTAFLALVKVLYVICGFMILICAPVVLLGMGAFVLPFRHILKEYEKFTYMPFSDITSGFSEEAGVSGLLQKGNTDDEIFVDSD